jgi:6-phosphogluconolactonase/glucosamine-6-phosphate isomerase/deaminase
MTLTYLVINRSRRIPWLATGKEKVGILDRLYKGDLTIPSGRIRREQAMVVADRAAGGDSTSA